MSKTIISFPKLGDYNIPLNFLFKHTTNCKIINSPEITKKTIELGSKYSPSDACLPFKYTLGNFIESLDMGANVLIQAGGGCRYRYYGEVQEQILTFSFLVSIFFKTLYLLWLFYFKNDLLYG